MEFFEEVIYEMYGFTLLEFLFYALDALVICACFIALLEAVDLCMKSSRHSNEV